MCIRKQAVTSCRAVAVVVFVVVVVVNRLYLAIPRKRRKKESNMICLYMYVCAADFIGYFFLRMNGSCGSGDGVDGVDCDGSVGGQQHC